MDLLWFILIGFVAGWLASFIMKGSDFGIAGDIALGVIGSLIGGYLFSRSGIVIVGSNMLSAIIVATIGAMLLLFCVRLIKRA